MERNKTAQWVDISKEVQDALKTDKAVVALESTIISHGMPYPQNKEFYNKAAEICYNLDVVPAAIAIINGVVHVGLDQNQVEHIATDDSVNKISKREIYPILWSSMVATSKKKNNECIFLFNVTHPINMSVC